MGNISINELNCLLQRFINYLVNNFNKSFCKDLDPNFDYFGLVLII